MLPGLGSYCAVANMFESLGLSSSDPNKNPGRDGGQVGLTITLRVDLGVSKNNGTPKSSILIEFSTINHPFWGTLIFGNTHLVFFLGGGRDEKQRGFFRKDHAMLL